MKKVLALLFELFVITLAGFFGSAVLGLMSYGIGIFTPGSIGFAFISFGLSGAFIFAIYHVRGLSETITAAVVVSAFQFTIATAWVPVVNAAFWSFGVNLPVILIAFVFERKLRRLNWAKFAGVALVYGTMFVWLTLAVGVVTGIQDMPALVFRNNFVDGLLLGLGLGLGVSGGEAFLHSLLHYPNHVKS